MKSVAKLEQYLQDEYINNPEMGSPNISSAIRDLLTDLMHVGDIHGMCVGERMYDAEEAYEQELSTETQHITGVLD